MQDFLLRCHTIDVSREHRAFFDVGDAEEAGGDTLQADGEEVLIRCFTHSRGVTITGCAGRPLNCHFTY